MIRFLAILISAILYCIFWNSYRKPLCDIDQDVVLEVPAVEPVPEPTEVEKLLFEPLDIYFQSASLEIIRTPQLEEWLSLAKNYLEENPGERLILTGHTDNEGTEESNLHLSLERSNRVKEILSAEGFASESIEVEGKGQSEPIAENDTPEGMQKNRRVSIRLLKR
jgi:OOP family OmpA-OmpF porin